MKRSLWVPFVSLVFLGAAGRANADTASFDFSSGIGPYFSVFNGSGNFPALDQPGGLFNVATNSSGIDVSKPADNGTISPVNAVGAGIRSTFSVVGNFSITVDFTLNDFPIPNQSEGLNESWLSVISMDYRSDVSVLRYNYPSAGNLIEGWTDPSEIGFGIQNSSSMSGRYQLQRSGSTITALFADPDSSSFTQLASVDGFPDPMKIQLFAAQNRNVGGDPRSTTSMDVSFNNLNVVADQIQGIPEPSTFVLFGIGAFGLLTWAWRQRKV